MHIDGRVHLVARQNEDKTDQNEITRTIMKNKFIFPTLCTLSAWFLTQPLQAVAASAALAPLRDAIVEFNAHNSSNAANRKLTLRLRLALKLIDKSSGTSVDNDIKVLAQVVPMLSRTTVADAFQAPMEQAINQCLATLYDKAAACSTIISGMSASRSRTTAEKVLATVRARLDQANASADSSAAARLLAQVPTKLNALEKSLSKVTQPPPTTTPNPKATPNNVTATVSGALNYDFRAVSLISAVVSAGGFGLASGVAIPGSSSPAYGLGVYAAALQPGDNTFPLGAMAEEGSYLIFGVGREDTGRTFESVSGTLHVSYNPATQTASGTFNATCVDRDDPTAQITVTGSFSVLIQ